jgi:hypothetical protein
MWNSTFGACEDGLEYPQKAKGVLLRLHPVVELQLPFFPESLSTEAQSGENRQPANIFGAQDESSQYSGFSSMESAVNGFLGPQTGPKLMQNARRSIPQVVITSKRSESLKRSREETPESSRRQSKRRDVTPRLRHNDSQAEFQAIPSSSPGFDKVLDSQLLTERQKEVKERQQVEAEMFPDLRSTPRSRSRLPESDDAEQELPQHRSSSKIREMISRSVDRETTPTAAIPSDDDNNYVESSPTPTRSMRAQVEDLPSSPPEAATKRRSPLDDQISSSPPEGTPEPTTVMPLADAMVEAGVLQQIQDPPLLVLRNQTEPEDEVMDDITTDPTEANIQADDSILNPKAALITADDATEISVVDETALGTGEKGMADDKVADIHNFEDDTTSLLEPSAQVDPSVMQSYLSTSTNEAPVHDRSSSPVDDPSDQLRASQLEHEAALASAKVQDNDQGLSQLSNAKSSGSVPSPIVELAMRPVYEPQILGTPRTAMAVDHSPKTPQFVDALSSPAGSDKHEHFEDALSSPRRNAANAPRMQESCSSPLSEIDESSMLRVVAEYDQSSSRRVSFLDDKENQPRRTQSLMSKDSQDVLSPTSSPSVPVKKSSLRKRSSLRLSTKAQEVISSEAGEMQTSSLPSLIPETPAPKAADSAKQLEPAVTVYRDDNGNEIDMNETIIVDTSILEREGGCLAHKRSPRKKGRKRKLLEDATSTSEPLDSQDGASEQGMQSQSPVHMDSQPATISASPSKLSAAPAKKRRRGRGSKSSEPNTEGQSSQDIDGSQSFLSIDANVSIAETNASILDERPMDGNERPVNSKLDGVNMVDRTSIDEDIVMDTILSEITSSAEIIAETTFEESSSAEKPSAASHEPEHQAQKEIDVLDIQSGAVTHDLVSDARALPERSCPNEQCDSVFSENGICSGCGTALEEVDMDERALPSGHPSSAVAVLEVSVDDKLEELDDVGVNGDGGGEMDEQQLQKTDDVIVPDAEVENAEASSPHKEPAVTVQSMKDKLQSLITDLHGAALSRQEINELEDMFMDAKRVLYGAELRGRQSADV